MFFSIVFIIISNEQILATEQLLSLWKVLGLGLGLGSGDLEGL